MSYVVCLTSFLKIVFVHLLQCTHSSLKQVKYFDTVPFG